LLRKPLLPRPPPHRPRRPPPRPHPPRTSRRNPSRTTRLAPPRPQPGSTPQLAAISEDHEGGWRPWSAAALAAAFTLRESAKIARLKQGRVVALECGGPSPTVLR